LGVTRRSTNGLVWAPIVSGIFSNSIQSWRNSGSHCACTCSSCHAERKSSGVVRCQKSGGEERRVIVAEILTEPAKPPRHMPAHHAKRRDESDIALGEAADGDHWTGAAAVPDVPLPGRQPIERLESGAVGAALELPPLGFDRAKLTENLNGKVRRDDAYSLARRRGRGGADVDRCVHIGSGHVL
jgi:hypothetical protein